MNNNTTTTKNNRIRERMHDAEKKAERVIDNTTDAVGRRLEHSAGTLEANSQRVVDRLSRTGRYLQESDSRQLGRDLGGVIQKHPYASIAAGVGAGVLIGRILSR